MRFWIKHSVILVASQLFITCINAQEKSKEDSTKVTYNRSHSIGIIGSHTEGIGIGYRYWTRNRMGYSVSVTPYYISNWFRINAGASILCRISLKHENRYPYLNLGASYTPILYENGIAGGIGFGYEWVIKDLFQFNIKLDALYAYEEGELYFPFPVPFPGIAMLLRL